MIEMSLIKTVLKETGEAGQDSELHALWQKIEKHQKRNAAFQGKLDKHFAVFQEVALPAELEFIQSVVERSQHLAQFITKKSLSDNERDALFDWLDEDLYILRNNPFTEQSQLDLLTALVESQVALFDDEQLDQVSEDEVNEFRAFIDDKFDGLLELTDEEIKACILDPAKLTKHFEKFVEAKQRQGEFDPYEFAKEKFSDEFDSEPDFDDFFEQADSNHHSEKSDVLEKLFKGSKLNKMYKRLASKLHPDKVIDEQDKQAMHEQMQALLHARKHKDVFTILQLYIAHFDDDPDIDSETLLALKPLLKDKVSQLNYEYRMMKSNTDTKTMVWNRFTQSSLKKTKQVMQEHAEDLMNASRDIAVFCKHTTTLKALKVHLKQRMKTRKEYEENMKAEFLARMFEEDFNFS